MEANGSKPGGEVPSLLADVEVSNLAGFDVMAPTTAPQPSPRPLLHTNTAARPRVSHPGLLCSALLCCHGDRRWGCC
uniref:Uncharacterized protein n=1 Tax=Oryza brachyantha TaxID=4533 RepID=J3M509_ORYBR